MDDTRVNRYKEYRQSFIKEGSISLGSSDDSDPIDVSATTATLPMGEVLEAVQAEKAKVETEKKKVRKHSIKLIIEIAVAVLLVIGLVILGIFAWGK